MSKDLKLIYNIKNTYHYYQEMKNISEEFQQFHKPIAKLEAYGLDREMVKLVYSCLKDRKQAVKVKGFVGILKSIISGVPQGSILGPILLNIFINDLLYFIEGSNFHNFADDNTPSDNADCIEKLIIKLEGLSDNAIDWMDNDCMIATQQNSMQYF